MNLQEIKTLKYGQLIENKSCSSQQGYPAFAGVVYSTYNPALDTITVKLETGLICSTTFSKLRDWSTVEN